MHADGGGLYLQIAEGGSKSWLFRYKLHGRTHWHGLGSLRDVGLEEAREGDRRAQNPPQWRRPHPRQSAKRKPPPDRIGQGDHVRRGGQAVHQSQSGRLEKRQACRPMGDDVARHRSEGQARQERLLQVLRDLPIGAIDTTLVLRIIEPIWARKTETATRIRSRIELVIDAAKAKGEFNGENPARWKGHLDNLLPATSKVRKVRNHPALPYRQLSDFMRKLRDGHGAAAAALESKS